MTTSTIFESDMSESTNDESKDKPVSTSAESTEKCDCSTPDCKDESCSVHKSGRAVRKPKCYDKLGTWRGSFKGTPDF